MAIGDSPLNYQTGVQVGTAVGKDGVLSGLLRTGTQADPNVAAFSRAMSMNDYSQFGRAIDATNADAHMAQQKARSEVTTQGVNNLARIYGDYAERSNAATDLAGQVRASNIGYAGGMAAARIRAAQNARRERM